jgi:hypothetical protein
MAAQRDPGQVDSTVQTDPADRALITELAFYVVESVAPEELPTLPLVTEEYFTDSAATLHTPGRDHPLGFGMDLALVGPYALALATPVVHFLLSMAADVARDLGKDAAKPVVRDLVRRMFHRDDDPADADPIHLTPAQTQWVRGSSYQNARALGLADEQAQLLADALVTNLTRGP